MKSGHEQPATSTPQRNKRKNYTPKRYEGRPPKRTKISRRSKKRKSHRLETYNIRCRASSTGSQTKTPKTHVKMVDLSSFKQFPKQVACRKQIKMAFVCDQDNEADGAACCDYLGKVFSHHLVDRSQSHLIQSVTNTTNNCYRDDNIFIPNAKKDLDVEYLRNADFKIVWMKRDDSAKGSKLNHGDDDSWYDFEFIYHGKQSTLEEAMSTLIEDEYDDFLVNDSNIEEGRISIYVPDIPENYSCFDPSTWSQNLVHESIQLQEAKESC